MPQGCSRPSLTMCYETSSTSFVGVCLDDILILSTVWTNTPLTSTQSCRDYGNIISMLNLSAHLIRPSQSSWSSSWARKESRWIRARSMPFATGEFCAMWLHEFLLGVHFQPFKTQAESLTALFWVKRAVPLVA